MNRDKKRTYSALALIGLLSSSGVLLLFYFFSGLTTVWEAKTLDYRFQLRGETPTDPGIVLIDCDDKSMKSIGRWPWKRSVHAEMIDLLKEAGAKNIAYDIIFSQPSEEREDTLLLSSITKAGNVIFPVGLELSSEKPESSGMADTLKGLSGITLEKEDEVSHSLMTVTRAVVPLKEMTAQAFASGHISANRDPDGVIRRVPLLVNSSGTGIPAFGLVSALSYLNINLRNLSAKPGYLSFRSEKGMNLQESDITRVPVNKNGMMLINYAGKWRDSFNHYSFSEILETSKTGEGFKRLTKRFSGKLCLVTNTATGFDIKTTPVEKDYPGGGIHANIINTILLKSFIGEAGKTLTVVIVLIMGTLTALLTSSGTRLTVALNLLLLISGYLALTLLCFTHFSYALPVLPPILTIQVSSIVTSLFLLKITQKKVGALIEEKEALVSEFDSVNGELLKKEKQINLLKEDLYELREQVLEDHKQEEDRKHQVSGLESKILEIGEERDQLKNKKELLDQRLSDLKVKHPEKPGLDDRQLLELKEECAGYGIITSDRRTLEAFKLLKKAAGARSPVLILGEAGTGKELFAKAVHRLSQRHERKMVTVNLPAITDTLIESELFGHRKGAFTGANENKIGKFELADGGSIFLDEIGEMKLELQSKLLRVLQAGEIDPVGGKTKNVDVRIIAATNKELKREVEKGSFRLDLFSRLNVITVTLPPLSDRPEDIELLTHFYIKYFNSVNGKSITGISEKAMKALKQYGWKTGNIRELKNTIDRASILSEGELITENDLAITPGPVDEPVPAQPVFSERVSDITGDAAFLDLMRESEFEINRVADELNQSRGTVAARFKGICFNFLVKERLNVTEASRKITNGNGKQDFVERKVKGYLKNLVTICEGFSDREDAILECMKRTKNIPQSYHASLREIINIYFAKQES